MADITQVQLTDTFSTLVDRLNEAIVRANALGAQAAIAITGGTISGVTVTSSSINSTPIGASSPSTGRFSSLSLDTPLAVTQGGTGATTAEAARSSLGFANASNLTEGVLADERIPNLSANKIVDGTFTVGDFSSDLSLTKSGAAKISAKGTGSSEVYSYLSLESDESEDKGWQIFHRKDSANRLAFYYNLTQMAAYFDPTTRGLVVGSTTSGGSPAAGSINAKSYYVDGVKISDAATSDLAGIIELATNAEAIAGADTSRAVTPAALTAVIADRIATSGEAIGLVNTTELITPATLAAVFGNSTARNTLQISNPTIETISSNHTLDSGDNATCKRITASCTISLDPAATLGSGWWCEIFIDADYNDRVVVTINPNSTEEVDEQTTVKAYTGESFKIYCNGTKFRTTRQTEVFMGTLDLSGNPIDWYTDGAFLDDPEISLAKIMFTEMSHSDNGNRRFYLRFMNGFGIVYSSSGDYNAGYITDFGDTSTDLGSPQTTKGAKSSTITEIDLTIGGSINSTTAANPVVVELQKYGAVAVARVMHLRTGVVPKPYWVTIDGEVGGFRVTQDTADNYDAGYVSLWATRRRLP